MGARPVKMSEAEIRTALAGLPTWRLADGKLHREYQFANFIEAFGFMAQAALVAEAMNHHPEWFNVYRSVRVDLATHDAGGVTGLDFDLAQKMEALARRQGSGG